MKNSQVMVGLIHVFLCSKDKIFVMAARMYFMVPKFIMLYLKFPYLSTSRLTLRLVYTPLN